MRPVAGFIALHTLFAAGGLGVLRAGRILDLASPRCTCLALGPATLVGASLVVTVATVLLVLGLPLSPLVALLTTIAALLVATAWRRHIATRRGANALEAKSPRPGTWRIPRLLATSVGAVYFVVGAWALSGLPTVFDDARIWSLRGLTLAYHQHLVASIFQNPGQAGGHPVYPLFQPALEALLFEFMGGPQLRFMHAEIWLMFGLVLWTAASLISRYVSSSRWWPVWSSGLVALAFSPALAQNAVLGDADVTGAALLALATLCFGFYLAGDRPQLLFLATTMLAAAASTKDEDLVAGLLTFIAAGMTALCSHRRSRAEALRWIASSIALCALILPWRLWTRMHHLTDGVTPKLPQALTPGFILHRSHALDRVVTAMLHQVLGEFGWLLAVFLVTIVAALGTRTATRAAWLYLSAVSLSAAALIWLYSTTSVPLSFLIPTSMNRTVDVFMLPCGLATAHLLAELARNDRRRTRPGSAAMQIGEGDPIKGEGSPVQYMSTATKTDGNQCWATNPLNPG